MKIEDVRTSFTVYVIASDLSRLEGIADTLGLAGYAVNMFSQLSSAFSELTSNPPHFLLLDALEPEFNLKKAIKQILLQLPESHVLLAAPIAQREQLAPFFEIGIYDLVYTPVVSATELVKAFDRAAERDYFMYTNEQLLAERPEVARAEDHVMTTHSLQLETKSTSPRQANADSEKQNEGFNQVEEGISEATRSSVNDTWALRYARRMFEQRNQEEALKIFLEVLTETFQNCPALFCRYFPNRRVLLISQVHNFPGADVKGLGINFNESDYPFRATGLREPQNIVSLANLIHDGLGHPDYLTFPVEALGEVLGVAVLLRGPLTESEEPLMRIWMGLINKAMTLIEAEKRLHVINVKDPNTDLLNRQNFILRLQQEISRSRRTQQPVSLALISVDQYGQIVEQIGQDEAQTVLRMAARIFEKHSRVNDVLGRTNADEFGLILPHTAKNGALIKTERLRRIIESADFTRVLRQFPRITVAIGVSEYPSFVRDAEELIQSADEALFQVRGVGNKTCLASLPEGFVPDFKFVEKGYS